MEERTKTTGSRRWKITFWLAALLYPWAVAWVMTQLYSPAVLGSNGRRNGDPSSAPPAPEWRVPSSAATDVAGNAIYPARGRSNGKAVVLKPTGARAFADIVEQDEPPLPQSLAGLMGFDDTARSFTNENDDLSRARSGLLRDDEMKTMPDQNLFADVRALRLGKSGQVNLFIYSSDGRELPARVSAGTSLTVLHFWASWCGPCLKELPYFDALWTQYRGREDVKIVIVSTDLRPLDASNILRDMGLSFELHIDPESELFDKIVPPRNRRSLPVTVVFGPKGDVRHAVVGSMTQTSASALETLLPPP